MKEAGGVDVLRQIKSVVKKKVKDYKDFFHAREELHRIKFDNRVTLQLDQELNAKITALERSHAQEFWHAEKARALSKLAVQREEISKSENKKYSIDHHDAKQRLQMVDVWLEEDTKRSGEEEKLPDNYADEIDAEFRHKLEEKEDRRRKAEENFRAKREAAQRAYAETRRLKIEALQREAERKNAEREAAKKAAAEAIKRNLEAGAAALVEKQKRDAQRAQRNEQERLEKQKREREQIERTVAAKRQAIIDKQAARLEAKALAAEAILRRQRERKAALVETRRKTAEDLDRKRLVAVAARKAASAEAMRARQEAGRLDRERAAEVKRQTIVAKRPDANKFEAIELAIAARKDLIAQLEDAVQLPGTEKTSRVTELKQRWRSISGGLSHDLLVKYQELLQK